MGGRGESTGDQWFQWGQTMDILACSGEAALGVCEGPICNLIFSVTFKGNFKMSAMCYLIFFGTCPGTVSKVLREIEMPTRLCLEPAFSKT